MLDAEDKPGVLLSGWGWLTLGQVKSSEYSNYQSNINFDEKPLSDLQAGLKLTASVSAGTKCKIHFMGSYLHPVVYTSMGVENAEPLMKSFGFSLLEASVLSKWKVADDDSITLEFGYFPVKYNPESMNLGEYLFRSNTYPGLLVSGFELSDKVRLAGIHTGYRLNTFSGSYGADIYLNTELETYPTQDISLSGLISFNSPKHIFDFSSGFSYHHLIPFDKKRIIPARNSSYSTQSASYVDTATGDTTEYSFRGVKAVTRFTFNPKGFFDQDYFGPSDLKVYAEAAILGIENYPGWYNCLRERIPIMVGFNIPAFKLLDILSVEVEYYPSPYNNSFHNMWKSNLPTPFFYEFRESNYNSEWKRKTDDDWKWSVYACKKFNNFRFSGQIASDHTSRSTYMAAGKKIYTEMCPRTKDWYYVVRCGFIF